MKCNNCGYRTTVWTDIHCDVINKLCPKCSKRDWM